MKKLRVALLALAGSARCSWQPVGAAGYDTQEWFSPPAALDGAMNARDGQAYHIRCADKASSVFDDHLHWVSL